MKEKLLEVKNLNVEYHSDSYVFHAVNGISFDLGCQETIGLVGETGAGKTTTALAIMQLLSERTSRVNSGEIIFKGENILARSREEMQELRGAKISMIFQDPMTCLNPLMTVGDQIREVLEIHAGHLELGDGKKQIEDRVDQLFELVGIPPVRGKDFPNQFSGGMKQRVMIAMALACNPELLIADEPTTALDVTIQAGILKLLATLQREEKLTVLFITNNLSLVPLLCDQTALLYKGQVMECGTVAEVIDGHCHPYTEALIQPLPVTEEEKEAVKTATAEEIPVERGCLFQNKCRLCTQLCREQVPEVVSLSPTHKVRCHRYQEGVREQWANQS